MTDKPTGEFWAGVWWRPTVDGQLRAATAGECAVEIQRLRHRISELEAENDKQNNDFAFRKWQAGRLQG